MRESFGMKMSWLVQETESQWGWTIKNKAEPGLKWHDQDTREPDYTRTSLLGSWDFAFYPTINVSNEMVHWDLVVKYSWLLHKEGRAGRQGSRDKGYEFWNWFRRFLGKSKSKQVLLVYGRGREWLEKEYLDGWYHRNGWPTGNGNGNRDDKV